MALFWLKQNVTAISDPCIAEMAVVRNALLEARKRKFQAVEIRLDVKGIVVWLQKKKHLQ